MPFIGASENALTMDFGKMNNLRPEGSNGSPVLGYQIDLATALYSQQRLTIIPPRSGFIFGEYKLSLGYERTRCISVSAPAFDVEVFVEELAQVDKAIVSLVDESLSNTSLIYDIKLTFKEPSGDRHLMLLFNESDCLAIDPPPKLAGIETLIRGSTSFRPHIVHISSSADDVIKGSMQLSFTFEGDFSNVLIVRNQVVQVKVDAGSREVNTMGFNLTGFLAVGEKIKILEEVLEISTIGEDKITLKYYHIRGTGEDPQNVYVMDNRIGVGWLEKGSDKISVQSEMDLRALVEVDDYIMFRDAQGNENIFQIRYFQDDMKEIHLRSNYYGDVCLTALFVRKRVLVQLDSTSHEMKKTIESLPGVGTVDVTRFGPSSSNGYTWMITFSSYNSHFLCPSMCLNVNTTTSKAIILEKIGVFVTTGTRNGQPYFESIDSMAEISFDIITRQWALALQCNSSVIYIPLHLWNDMVKFVDSPVSLIKGDNADVNLSAEQVFQAAEFTENIVFSKRIVGRISEVQKIQLTSDDNDIKGYFRVSFADPRYEVTVNCHSSASDLAHQLMSLPSIGRVAVTHEPSIKQGFQWHVTFLSNQGDLEKLQLRYIEGELRGTNIKLEVIEEVKGVAPNNFVILDGLDPGLVYTARVVAFNGEGEGPFTTSVQNKGKGVLPLHYATKASPGKPELFVKALSSTELEVKYSSSDPHGDPVRHYKIEWTTDSSFGTPEIIEVSIRCTLECILAGSFIIVLDDEEVSYMYGKTQPITFNASASELRAALILLPDIGDVVVEKTVQTRNEVRWRVTFEKRIGHLGNLFIDTAMLLSLGNRYAYDDYGILFHSQPLGFIF
jgi:hypothetical protein